MQNKIWIAVGVVLVISLVGVYFALSGQQKAGGEIAKLVERLDREVQRFNARTSAITYTGEPIGYVIEFENGAKFYVAGDTAPSADMKLVIGDYYKPDVAILPIGGWFTMGPKEAAFATSLVRPKSYVIPYHYASYPMLEQSPTGFFEELEKYNLIAQPLSLVVGEEKEVMGVKMVWLGHASLFLVSPEGKKILVDPATPLGLFPEKYKDFTGFGVIDLVLLTHGHPDHVVVSDLDKLVGMYGPVIFAPFELGHWLIERVQVPDVVFYLFNKGTNLSKADLAKVGIPTEKIGDIRIHAVSANHTSSMAPE